MEERMLMLVWWYGGIIENYLGFVWYVWMESGMCGRNEMRWEMGKENDERSRSSECEWVIFR